MLEGAKELLSGANHFMNFPFDSTFANHSPSRVKSTQQLVY